MDAVEVNMKTAQVVVVDGGVTSDIMVKDSDGIIGRCHAHQDDVINL